MTKPGIAFMAPSTELNDIVKAALAALHENRYSIIYDDVRLDVTVFLPVREKVSPDLKMMIVNALAGVLYPNTSHVVEFNLAKLTSRLTGVNIMVIPLEHV
jgi:ribulose 1,5-bisphosphate carboxylase large subunit-like protein